MFVHNVITAPRWSNVGETADDETHFAHFAVLVNLILASATA